MTLDWQNSIALVLVVLAAAYLGWRGWLVLARRKAGCGACASCPAEQSQTIAGKPLVTLEANTKPQRAQRTRRRDEEKNHELHELHE
jgi:hypothetical protein